MCIRDSVKIDANRRYVVFTTNGYTIMSRLIEGDFLNYESVIPKDKKTRITVDCKTFIDTIERASLIITERLKNPLRISFTENKITVRCQTPLGKVVDEFAPVETVSYTHLDVYKRQPMCSPVTRRIVASPFLTAVKLNSSTPISLKIGVR